MNASKELSQKNIRISCSESLRISRGGNVTARIEDCWWNRIYLCMHVRVFGATDCPAFVLVTQSREAKVGGIAYSAKRSGDSLSVEGALFEVAFNVTNNGADRCIGPGTYRLCLLYEGPFWVEAEARPEFAALLSESDEQVFPHCFKFNNGRDNQAFDAVVTVGVSSRFLVEVTVGHCFDSPVRERLALAKSRVSNGLCRCTYRGLRQFRKADKNKPVILFASEKGCSLGPNLMAVRNRLRERGLDEFFQVEETLRDSKDGHNKGLKNLLDVIRVFARADFILMDDYVSMLKRLGFGDDVVIAQLWHGGLGFKASGYARWGLDHAPQPFSSHRCYTYGICTSSLGSVVFSEIFGISEPRVIPTGMPRMDGFLNESREGHYRRRLIDYCAGLKGKRVILFAPTYRGEGRDTAFYPYEQIDFERFYRFCGEENVVAFRMHPWVKDPVPIPECYADRLFDLGGYDRLFDLFFAADVLITDYSSLVFEYALLEKPMLFYSFDEAEYAATRSFHRPYEQVVPGKVCRTFDDLMESLEKGDYGYERTRRYIEESFDFVDDHATDRVIDWFILGQLPEEYRAAIVSYEDSVRMLFNLVFVE